MSDAEAAAARLWLGAMHAIGRPLAHEVKNALNGLAVNLEVVRARAAKPDAPAATVARFADAAADQLELVTELCEGMLSLVRPAPAAVELPQLVVRLATLLRAVARPDGGDVTVAPYDDSSSCTLDGVLLRPVVAALMVGAFDRAARLSCEITGGEEPSLRLSRGDGSLPDLPDDLRAVAERAGVRLDVRPEAWTATFPGRGRTAADLNSEGVTHA